MSLKLHFPVVRYRKLPPLFFASVGALLGLLVTAFVLGERAGQKNKELLKEFGETVVTMGAHEAVDFALKDDLVGLHAVMQSLIAQPRIKMATVHSVDQQLLVQAGQVKNQVDYQVFTAPIALHDSVAGHVNIAIDTRFPGDAALRWTLTGTAFLLSLMILLTLYESRGDAWYFPRSNSNTDPSSEDDIDPSLDVYDEYDQSHDVELGAIEDLEDEYSGDGKRERPEVEWSTEVKVEDDGAIVVEDQVDQSQGEVDEVAAEDDSSVPPLDEVKPRSKYHSDLIVALPNYARLQQQLNKERFDSLEQEFVSSLDEILGLYGGELVGPPHNNNVYCVRFTSSESVEEAAFRAACSAHLIDQLNTQKKIRFNLLAEICHPDEDVKLAVSQTGIFLHSALVLDLLNQRLVLIEDSRSRYQLDGFQPPFAALLERQLQQLSSLELIEG